MENILQKEFVLLMQRNEIIAAYIFGSRAKEIADLLKGGKAIKDSDCKKSDIDIGIKLRSGKKLSVIEKVDIASELEDLFDCARIDLIMLDEADPFLAKEIICGERVFSEDEVLADEYDLFVLRRAGDLSYLEAERQDLILRGSQ